MTTYLSTIPVRLIEHGFNEFAETNSSLLIEYHTQRPYTDPERDITKKTYFKHMRAVEKKYNEEHSQSLREFEEQSIKDNPLIKKEELYRLILQKESDLVTYELSTRFKDLKYGIVKLKIDEDNFTRDRWLKALVSHYTAAQKVQKTATFQTERITKCIDIDLFKSNVGINGEGVNRSPFSVFSEQALIHLKTTCFDILKREDISEGILSEQIGKLRQISAHERILLLSNAFINSFSHLQYMQSASLYKIQNICELNGKTARKKSGHVRTPDCLNYPLDETRKRFLSIIRGEQVSTSSPRATSSMPKQLQKRLPSSEPHLIPAKKSPSFQPKLDIQPLSNPLGLTERERVNAMNTFIYSFFIESKCVLNSLSDFLTLLQLRLEMDFTREEHEHVKKIQDNPHTMEEELPIDAAAQDIIKIEGYIKIFKVTEEILKFLITKTPPPPIAL